MPRYVTRVRHNVRDWWNTRWFDVSRGVRTCGEGTAAGNGHQPAWTSEVRYWFRRLHTQPGFIERTFVDVGCGKGKVLLAWREQLDKAGLSQEILGVEFDGELVCAARRNIASMEARATVWRMDATRFEYASLQRPLIVWLFNPFGEDGMRLLAGRLAGTDTWLVYHNPKHAGVFMDAGWWPVSIKPGTHEKSTSMLLASRQP